MMRFPELYPVAASPLVEQAEPSEEDQRKLFEVRARKSDYSLGRHGDEYRHPPTQHAWQGWMMGAEVAPDRAGVASLVAGEESDGRLGTLDQLP